MAGSVVVYAGAILLLAGLCLCVRPVPSIGIGGRGRALALAAAGVVLAAAALVWPGTESRTPAPVTRLDFFAPVWHFNEVHTRKIAAPPSRVFEALRQVRADEIQWFHTLTWIRRGGRNVPPSILNAGRILEGDLSGQRDHSTNVVACDRPARRVGGPVTPDANWR